MSHSIPTFFYQLLDKIKLSLFSLDLIPTLCRTEAKKKPKKKEDETKIWD